MVGVDDAVGVVAAAVGGGGGGDGGAGGCWWCSLMSSLLSVLLFLLAFAVVVAGAGDAGASAIVRGVPPSSTVRFVRLCRLGRGSRSPLFLFNVFRGEAVVCLLARLAAPGAGETQDGGPYDRDDASNICPLPSRQSLRDVDAENSSPRTDQRRLLRRLLLDNLDPSGPDTFLFFV